MFPLKKQKMSDHDCVNILSSLLTRENTFSDRCEKSIPEKIKTDFKSLNYQKADFNKINEDFRKIDWPSLLESASIEELLLIFNEKVFEICKSHTPIWKDKKTLSFGERKRRSLNRRKYKLRGRIAAIEKLNPNSHRVQSLKQEIMSLQSQIKNSAIDERRFKELIAINAIKSDTKSFYKYAKKIVSLRVPLNFY